MFSAALLGTALFSLTAQAQSGSDAGSSTPEPAAPPQPPAAAEDDSPEPQAPDLGTTARFVPKTLRDGQRLPENMQNWLHERGANRPTHIVRNAAVAPPEREPEVGEDARAVRSRRMRSFDESGITVLSNRVSHDPPPLARVRPTRVAGPVPLPPRLEPTEVEPEEEQDQDLEPRHVTETRSLRAGMARASAPRRSFDDGFGWATLAAGGSALGLAALWFRRRGRAARRASS